MKTDDRRPLFRRSLAGVVLAAVLLALWGAATHGSLPSGSTEPVIASLTPESGPEGMVVTIRGTNFGPSVGALQGTSGVSFNGVWSTPTSWSDREIQVAVPPGAATGEVLVTVSGQQSAGVEFDVTGTGGSGPAIGTVSPGLGLEGTVVTVRGANFGPTADMGGVSFNGVWAAASSWSDTEIRVPVPVDAATGSVVVTANGVASNGVAFIVTDTGLGEPVIDSLSAASGLEGTVVTIEGSSFGPSIRALEGTSGVSFNGVWGEPTSWSETQIQVAVPAGAPSGLVAVAVAGEGSNGLAFVVERPAPLIEAVDTTVGPEGTTVEISGRNFGPAMEAVQGWSGVSFDGLWGMPTYWSDREIHVSAPAGVSGGLIVVTSVGQESNGIPFTVARSKGMPRALAAASTAPRAGPELKSLAPEQGPVGTAVKIKGKNLGDEQGTSTVTFNGTEVEDYVSWANKRIDVEVPVGATTGEVVVTVSGVPTAGIEFTVTAGTGPAISLLDPDSGPEGTSVEITGVNFGASQGTSTVSFNGVAGTATSWSDTSITAAVPMGATTGEVVVTVDGTASSGVSFTVAPAIGSLSPIAGPEGTMVEITGTSFGASQGTSSVTFNGTGATPSSWSDSSITVTVPAGAATGSVVVTVGGTPSSGASFTVTPAIGSLSPIAGPEGTTVEISGTSFGAMQGTSTVTFNGTGAAPTGWSSTSITVTVPAGATTGPVVVTVGGEASNGVSFAVGSDPVISGLNPDSGPAGTTVEITGANFGASQGTSTVEFNGAGATPSNWSDTSITVAVPGNATTGPVVVTVDGTASNAVTFSVKPVVGGLSRVSGPEGATVVITGTGFGASQGTSSVTFNGAGTTPTSWSDTSITVTVPANAATGDVVVTVDGTVSDGVSFTVTPAIGSLSPIAGPEGATVEITGTSFGAMQGTSTVTFNGTGATPTSWSGTSITVTVPAGATTGNVVVTVGGVASNGVSFTVGTDPIVTSLSPALGQVETTVVIGGANFGASQGTGTVTFNGVAATVTSWSDSSITVTVPATAATGPVVVTVGGEASNQVTFTVTGPPPEINKLKPGGGEVGDSVKVKGEHFGTAQGTSTVTFNGLKAAARKWDDDKITVNVPAGARTGPVVVTVDGQASNPVTFSVTGSSPSIISLDPTSGEAGTPVTITGVYFGATQGTSTVTFNGVATTASSWSDASITVPVPATAATGPVVVTVGGEASNQVTFTVTVPAPSITGLEPTSGRTGASVTITGENFGASRGTSTVTFNGTPAATYTIWSDTSITVTVPTNATTGSVVVTVGGQVSNGVEFTVEETTPGVTVTETALDVDEGSTRTYQVKLDTEPGASVTVTPASSETAVATVSPPTLTFTTSNWNVAQEVTVTGAQDDDGVNGTATITHTAESTDTGYNDISPIGSVVVSVDDNDPFGVTVTEATLDVDEGNTGIYQVKLDTEPSADVTITPASGDTDVATVSPPLTFTTSNWNTAQEVTVTGTQDDDGSDETATISHTATSTDSDYNGISPIGSVVVSVDDNDPFGVTVTETTLDVVEGNTETYQVKLDTKPGADVTVSIAEASDAISVSSSSLTFTTSNWNTAQEVTVTGAEDDDTADEEATITHTATSTDSDYNGISPIGSVVVSIEDKDHPQITLSSNQTSVSEPSGTATITASVASGSEPEADLTIALAHSGTAAGGTDYSAGTLTILAGQISGEATLSVTDDSIDEDEETIALTASAAGYEDSDVLTIALEDDGDTAGLVVSTTQLDVDEGADGQFQVKLNSEPLNNVTVSVAEASDAISVSDTSLTFTSSNWSTYKTVTVTGVSDDDYADETATITTSATSSDPKYNTTSLNQSVSVSVKDAENPPITLSSDRTSVSEPSGTATITARVPIGSEPEADLTITLAHSGTAADSSDYTVGALTILAGRTSGEATLSVADDSIDEDEETIVLTGSAAGYKDSDALSIALEDDGDTAGLVVSTTQLDINEGADGQFQVKLNTEPTADVTVTPSSDNTDVTVLPSSLTFTSSNWSAYQTVTVTGLSDDDYADETATITASATSSDAKYNTASLNQTVGVNVDDGENPPITLSSGRTSVSEPSGTATITASVPSGHEPEADLAITLAHSGTAGSGTDYSVGALTILAGQALGEATLSVTDDSIDEDEETIALTGSAAGYKDSDALSIALEDDGDTAGLVVSTTQLDVDEGADGQFQVKLNSEPLNNVTVSVAEASDAISVSSDSLTFTSSNWSAYQTVTVTGLSDDDYADETATITASATSSDAKYNTTSLNQTVSVMVDDTEDPPITLSSSRTSVSEPSGTATITASVPSGYEPEGALAITLAHSGTAGGGTDYTVGVLTIQAGQASGEATLSVTDDSIDEDEETITLTGSATGYAPRAALSIALEDDDTAALVVSTASLDIDEGEEGQFQVKLNTEPLNNVTVSIAEASDAISVSDTSLTFTSSNWSTYKTVTVTGLSDSNYADETATITTRATSSDAKYNTTSLNQTVSVSVRDDEPPPITLSSNRTSVSEPSGTATITASVPGGYAPDSDTPVSLARSGDAGSSDYTVGALTILAGRTSGTATLSVTDDRIDEDAETIGLRASASGYADSAVLSITLEDDNDTAALVVSTTSLDIDESGNGRFRVKLNSRPTATVTVSVRETSSKILVDRTSLTFTTTSWNTDQTVTVTGSSDSDCGDEEDVPIILSPSSSDPKYNTTSLNETVNVDVDDDDTPRLTLSSSRSSVSEPSGTATITARVQSGCAPSSDKTITLTPSGSATKGTDYTVGTLTIQAHQTSGTATLSVTDDRIDEGASETIRLTASASGYTSSSPLSIPLIDNDDAALVVSTTSLDIDESGNGRFRVKLNSRPTATVTVSVRETSSKILVDRTSLTFTTTSWNTDQTVTVTGSSDSDCGDEEDVPIILSPSSSDPKYNTTSLNETVNVDVDDDDTPRLTLSSSRSSVSEPSGTATITARVQSGCAPSSDKTITLTPSGSATKGTDYTVGTLTIQAHQTSGTATLSVTDDRIDEGASETIRLTASASGYTSSSPLSIPLIDNDDAALVVSTTSLDIDESGNGRFRVKLNSRPTATVTVSVRETSSKILVDRTSLTFTTTSWNTDQTVTVTGSSDSDCGDEEDVPIILSPSSSDPKYNTTSLNETVNVDVDDDDTPRLTLSSSRSSVSEPSGTATITARVQSGCAPSSNKTITLTASGDATKGTDYTVGTLTIQAGQTSGTATLRVVDDDMAEGAETIKLRASAPGCTSSSLLMITLNDNDMAGLVVVPTSLTIGEDMEKSYHVKLKSQPKANVTVSVSEDSSKISVSPSSLTFTASNWSTNKSVRVEAHPDSDCTDETAPVSNESSSSDLMYSNFSVDVNVTVIDDENPTITLSSNRTSVSEPSGTATITATLGCTSSVDKTIALDHLGSAKHGTNKDYTVGTLTVEDGELTGTVTLTVKDDNICEGTETIKLKGRTSGYTDSSVLSITLNDNDTAGIVVSTTSLTITEGNDGTYDVKLNSQPTHSVSVSFSVSGSSTVTVPTSSRTFTTSNWNTYQTVTVRPAEDDSDYSNESATVTNSATSSDSKYNTTNLNKTVSVSVTDDDTAPPATPSISSIRPPLQRPDDPVTIYGIHFGSTAGSVSFGGDSISIFNGRGYSWSNTSISLLIPGSLYAGQVSVSVTTNGGSTSNSYSYTVTGGPVSRGDCEEEGEDCPGDDKPKKDGSGGGDSEESEDPPGDGG